MFRWLYRSGGGLVIAVALCVSVEAADAIPAAVPTQHRVEVVVSTNNERVDMTRRVDRGVSRTDLRDDAGVFATVIERPDKQAVYVSVPDRGLYLEGPIARRSASPQPWQTLHQEPLGRVTLGGRSADKFKLSNAHGAADLWVEPGTHHPIRLQDTSTRVDWGPFAIGAQPTALFSPPARDARLGIPDFLGGPNGALGQLMGDQIPLILAQQLGDDLAAKIRRASRTPLGVTLSVLFGPTWEKMLLNTK